MKKITALLTAVLLTACCGLFASAQQTPAPLEIQVQANSSCTLSENLYLSPIENGSAEIQTREGTAISGSHLTEQEGLYLCVVHIVPEETDARQWLDQIFTEKGTVEDAYEIFLSDENGNRIQPDEHTLLSFSGTSWNNAELWEAAGDETIQKLDFQLDDNQVITSGQPGGCLAWIVPGDSSPETGESGFLTTLCIVIVIGSAAAAAGLGILSRKKNADRR